jgi:hypothetical protein
MVALVVGLGDLRQATVGVDDVDPCLLVDGGDRLPDRRGLADRDRVADLVAAAGADGLGRPEPRIHPHGQLPRRASPPDSPGELVDEAGGAAGGVGPPGALAGVQHLTAVGTAGNKRVVAQGVGVAEV